MEEKYVPDEEQDKNPQEQLSEVEIDNLPEKEFRVIIVKMIQNLGKRMEPETKKIEEMFNNELEGLKNKQTEMNNSRISSRINEAEE